MSRRVAIVTGTRAEYSHLVWIMRALQARHNELQLIVTGTHLSPDHGMTLREIEADGFPIAARVDIELHHDKPVDVASSMGLALSGIAATLDRLKPAVVVILGDRYEMLAAASAAYMLHIPIAHLHGGELTEGVLDESMRHAITKLAYWHFASSEPYAARIRQLGEDPLRIFTTGAPAIDNLAHLSLLPRPVLEKEFGAKLGNPLMLFTYHPETLSRLPPDRQIDTVLAALEQFPDTTILMSGANADAGGRAINHALQHFMLRHPRTLFRMHFGSVAYLSAMREADLLVGNSSSALIEAQAMGKAAVNIGERQAGRLRTSNVIDCPCDTQAISEAIERALSPQFRYDIKPSMLFGVPGKVSPRIAELIDTLPLPETPYKRFHDME